MFALPYVTALQTQQSQSSKSAQQPPGRLEAARDLDKNPEWLNLPVIEKGKGNLSETLTKKVLQPNGPRTKDETLTLSKQDSTTSDALENRLRKVVTNLLSDQPNQADGRYRNGFSLSSICR